MHRGIALAVCCAISSLPLSACGGEDGESRSPVSPSESPTSTGTTTSPPEDPAPPEMPALATQKSTAGAKAFVGYAIDVLNYSHKVTSSSPFRRISAQDCRACDVLSSSIDKMARHGGQQQGGEWTPVTTRQLSGEPSEPNFVVQLKVAEGTARLTQDSRVEVIRSSTAFVDFRLVWPGDSWLLQDMSPG